MTISKKQKKVTVYTLLIVYFASFFYLLHYEMSKTIEKSTTTIDSSKVVKVDTLKVKSDTLDNLKAIPTVKH